MLRLPNITLCTLGDEKYREMNQKALDYSSREIEFGAVKNIIHPCGSIDNWNKAIIFNLWEYIDTDYALLIHPDGYVVNPESWRDEFLNHDFIGAPWPLPQDEYSYRTPDGEIVRVGNSVSLRSKKLMELASCVPEHDFWMIKEKFGNTNEDGFITCHLAPFLIGMGCKFAPIEVAKWFSRELDIPENVDVDKPFAFHRTGGRNSEFKDFENAI